jgi:hypothetical protein
LILVARAPSPVFYFSMGEGAHATIQTYTVIPSSLSFASCAFIASHSSSV